MKTKKMKLNDDLLDLKGVCNYFGLSETTIRRKIKDTREGRGNFILPLFGSICRILFRRADVENWKGEDAEVVSFTPSLPPPNPQVLPSDAEVRRGLEAMGIKYPCKPSNESNK
jgi:predicted DNA-binding transcriptional regulator AlpA